MPCKKCDAADAEYDRVVDPAEAEYQRVVDEHPHRRKHREGA